MAANHTSPPKRERYRPTYHPDGRKVYDPGRTARDINDEWEVFEERVRAEDPECRFPGMKAREMWRREEETKERWSEWQKRVWFPRMRALAEARDSHTLDFTKEEVERLIEHFAGANDPVAQSILAKALSGLA